MARAMKDSGIEWIGQVPEDWETSKIGQIYSERNEKVSDYDFEPLSVTMQGIVPQLSTAAKSDAHDDRKLVKKGDFAINSRSDRRGSCGISPVDGSVSLINTILKLHKDMNWVFHSTMFSDEFYKWGHGIVNDLWTTRWQDMKKISIPSPKIDEQQKIANFLDSKCASIDAVIEKTKASIEEYKKLKQAVITQAVTKGIRPNRKMKDSGIETLNSMPAEWKRYDIKHLVSRSITDGTHMTPDYTDIEEGVPFLSSKDISSGSIDWSNIKYITKELHKELYKNVAPQIGDILLAKNGTTGVAAIVEEDKEFDIYVTLALIRPNRELVLPKYLLYSINSQLCKRQFDEHLKGIGVPNLHLGIIANTSIFLPDMIEQNEIVKYLDQRCVEIDLLIEKKEQFLIGLEVFKKSIIYEYVTGKKEVPDCY